MKEKITNILNLWNEIKVFQNERLEKEDNIISCISLIEKGIKDEELNNIQRKQQHISFSLIELNDKLTNKIDFLGEVLKGVSEESLKKGKLSFDILSYCMYSGVPREKLAILKEVYKSFSEEVYLDIPKNQELNRVGKKLKEYFLKNN